MDPVVQLEREWQTISRGELARALPGWGRAEPALAGFTSPGRLLARLQQSPPPESDPPLYALLALAAHDPGAARVCLQAILPALKAQAARIVYARGGRDELWGLLLGCAWEGIRRYPVARTRAVAANLVLGILHETTRELRRAGDPCSRPPGSARGGSRALPALPLEHAARIAASPPRGALGAEGVVASAVASGVLEPAEGELILRTRVDGAVLRELAALDGVPYDALRKRRQRAEARLRAGLG